MARVKIEEIVDHLDGEFRRALRETFAELAPNAGVNDAEAFRVFQRKLRLACATWERVPDRYVEAGS